MNVWENVICRTTRVPKRGSLKLCYGCLDWEAANYPLAHREAKLVCGERYWPWQLLPWIYHEAAKL